MSAFLLSLVFSLSLLGGQAGRPPQNYSFEEAQKVLRAIDRMTADPLRSGKGGLREIAVTESELNSYIAYRIESEKEEIMKELRLRLLDDNKIEGKIHVDLRGHKLPQFLRPELDFFFSADLEVANGAAKVRIRQLFLGDQPIQPLLLDLIIALSAQLDDQEATSIADWYELPFGIKDIRVRRGQAFFYY